MPTIKMQKYMPNGWRRVRLGFISEITNGKTNSQDAVIDGPYPLFDRSVSIKKSDKYLFDKTAIIIPGEGAEFVPRIYSGKFDLHQRAYAIFPTSSVFPPYLFQYLYANRSAFSQNSVGSTVKSLRLPIIQAINVLLPPLSEQRSIAEILSSVDSEIEKTQAIIDSTEKLKKGLMQKLFTKGIGHTKYKKSIFGNIPEVWKILSMEEIVAGERNSIKIGPFGSQLKKVYLKSSGYKVYGQENVFVNNFIIGKRYIDSERYALLESCKLLPGDIIISMMGTIGQSAMIPESIEPGIMDSHLLRLRLNEGVILKDYFLQLFPSEVIQTQVKSLAVGGIMAGLSTKIIRRLNFPLPEVSEQEKIAGILSTVNEKLSANQILYTKLGRIKKGLMHDLLSGRVRVAI